MLTVVDKPAKIHTMLAGALERADHRAVLAVTDEPVVVDVDRTGVEHDMVVWAQAQHVAFRVRAVVWTTEALNMGRFGIEATRCANLQTADLAGVIVQFLDAPGHPSVSHQSLEGDLGAFCWTDRADVANDV